MNPIRSTIIAVQSDAIRTLELKSDPIQSEKKYSQICDVINLNSKSNISYNEIDPVGSRSDSDAIRIAQIKLESDRIGFRFGFGSDSRTRPRTQGPFKTKYAGYEVLNCVI